MALQLIDVRMFVWINDLKSAEIETVNQKETKQPDYVFISDVP